jgi:hypothetical protein
MMSSDRAVGGAQVLHDDEPRWADSAGVPHEAPASGAIRIAHPARLRISASIHSQKRRATRDSDRR